MTYKLEIRGNVDPIVKDVLVTDVDKDGQVIGQFSVKWNINTGADGLKKHIEKYQDDVKEAVAAQDEHSGILAEVEAVLNASK